MDIEDFLCGIRCIIRVHHWEPHQAAKVYGPPEDCYPSEGGYGEWEVLTPRGCRSKRLDTLLETHPDEHDRIEELIFDKMENPRHRGYEHDARDYYDYE